MARPSRRDYLLKIISSSKGLSRKNLSEISGVKVSNLWRAETGLIVSDGIVLKIAKVLDISPDILYYNMGRFPPDKMEFIIKDPLFFKELIDEACQEPWRLTKTQEYMDSIKEIKSEINPAIGKILKKLRPTE